MIFKYGVFKSSEDFELWQTSNKVCVSHIQPFLSDISGDVTEHGTIGMETKVSVFVTYWDQE